MQGVILGAHTGRCSAGWAALWEGPVDTADGTHGRQGLESGSDCN